MADPRYADRFEQHRAHLTDGARPEAVPLGDEDGKALPLGAFTILHGGDVFDTARSAPSDGRPRAEAFFDQQVTLAVHGASEKHVARVRQDIITQLSGNPQLSRRMQCAKALRIDLVPDGQPMSALGYPKGVSRQAAGLFWDRPQWESARIALRQDHLDEDAALVSHEMAHAIHHLGFTKSERELIYDLLRPTFGSRRAIDEVFAIYSEREFIDRYTREEQRAPGVYGFTRRQWSEDHLFTRFVRKLYFPSQAAAGPKMGGPGSDWTKGLARRGSGQI